MRRILGINIVLIFLCYSISAIAAPVVAVDTDPVTPGVQHHIPVAIGTSFKVDIVVIGVEEARALNVFEFDLGFDPAIVRATSVVSGGFLPSPSAVIESDVTPPDVNFTEGAIGPHTAHGNGILATVTFTALSAGVTVLDLNNVILAALGGINIPGSVIDGAITVLSPTATLSLTPTAKTVTVGEMFNVDIVLSTGGTETTGVDIRYLRYDPRVLAVLDSNPSAPEIQIQPGVLYPIIEANSVDASNGTIHFSQITSGGATVNGSAVLATIVFKAIGVGTTDLIFDFSGGVTTDTNVAIAGVDVLANAFGARITATGVIDKIMPTVTIAANPTTLWPPNGKMVPVTISGSITDDLSGVNASTAVHGVTDEYGQVQPTGSVALRPDGSYSFIIQLQASRRGNDQDGRQYIVTISAQDNAGNMGSAATGVIVPHDQGKK